MKLSEVYQKVKGKIDDKELLSATNTLFDTAQRDYSRMMMEKIWFRNILYYLGEQYLEYIKSTQSFRRRILPDYIPTPVSNEICEYCRSVKAMILNQKLVLKVAPNSNDKDDIKAAELGETLMQWMDGLNEGEFQDEKEKVALQLPLFGTGFMRTYPFMNDSQWVFDKDGNPINTGEVGSEAIIPFQVFVDMLGDRLNKKRWIGIQSLKSREWVEDIFKVNISGGESIATIDYNRRLMHMVGQVSPWKGAGLDASVYTADDDDLVLFREVEMSPTRTYPLGRYIISCGDKLLKKYDRLPIKTENGKWYYSLTDFHFDYSPGCFWSNAGVNNLISPQNTINEIDQALSINRKGLGRPKLFSPGEIGLKRVDHVDGLGVGLLMVQYDPILSGGQKPSIENGTPLPNMVLEERSIQRTVIQDVSGDPKNILRGDSPGSKASGIMVDILRETAEKGHYPDIDRYIRAMTRVNKKRMLIAQEMMTEERILKIAGRGNKWKITKFKAADLRDNTDLRMELDSGIASTNAGKMDILLDFAQRGILGNVAEDQELKQELLRRAGLSGFTEQENPDTKRADYENALIESGEVGNIMVCDVDQKTGTISPESEVLVHDPFFKYDNHQIHYETHRRCIMSEAFGEWDEKSKQIMISHTDTHHMQLVEDQKNVPPEPHDPREFVQMDKLYSLLTRKEQMFYLKNELHIEPDMEGQVAGIPSAQDIMKQQQESRKNDIDEKKLVVDAKKDEDNGGEIEKKATGGRVNAGEPYIVGERGVEAFTGMVQAPNRPLTQVEMLSAGSAPVSQPTPTPQGYGTPPQPVGVRGEEVFVPRQDGTIIPNNKIAEKVAKTPQPINPLGGTQYINTAINPDTSLTTPSVPTPVSPIVPYLPRYRKDENG